MLFERPERQSTLVSPNALRKLCAKPTRVGPTNHSAESMILRMSTVAHIDAIQAEYSAFETLHETSGLIDTARELGITFVAYSPLGHGWLVDEFQYKSPDDFAPTDFRRTGKSYIRYLVDLSKTQTLTRRQHLNSKERTSTRTAPSSRRSRSSPLVEVVVCLRLLSRGSRLRA